MDISRISQTRHTAKAFDPNQKIPAETIEKLRILLRNAPSSVNSQPWHFLIASTPAGRARIAKATQGSFAYNEPKVRNASHVVVLCARKTLDDAHLSAVLGQEQVDGRFATPEAMATQDKSRRFYVGLHQTGLKDERYWIERQVYLALGTLLLGAGSLQIDACPMEGGTSQDSCRLIHAIKRIMFSACTCSRTTASRSGLSVTAPTGVQSRVPRDQRAGCRSRAWRYV